MRHGELLTYVLLACVGMLLALLAGHAGLSIVRAVLSAVSHLMTGG